jgi:hypothetical protein
MTFFDKPQPWSKIFCDSCKKEIEPGQELIISIPCPSREEQMNMKLFEYSYFTFFESTPKYHKECFFKKTQ